TMDTLVSVVVRACNHQHYVEAALQSAYEQDHQALELIIVDDGSSDRTRALVSAYASDGRAKSRFRRVLVIEQEKTIGAAASFNRGIRESSGQYVNVLPGDERLMPGRVTALLRACLERPTSLAFARVEPCADGPLPSVATRQHVYGLQDSIGYFPTVGYALL